MRGKRKRGRGGMHDKGACMVGGHAWQGEAYMTRGHVWQGACMVGEHVCRRDGH